MKAKEIFFCRNYAENETVKIVSALFLCFKKTSYIYIYIYMQGGP